MQVPAKRRIQQIASLSPAAAVVSYINYYQNPVMYIAVKTVLFSYNNYFILCQLIIIGCAMRLVLSLILLVTFVVLAGALLCNYYYGSQECQRLWAEFIAMVTQGFESLGIKFSNQN